MAEVSDDDVIALIAAPLAVVPEASAVAMVERLMRDELTSAAFDLPPFPGSAARVLELAERPDLDLNELVSALHWEPAVVAHVLAMASSVQYRGAPIDDLRTAVLQLGLAEVGAIAAAVASRSLYEAESRAEYELFPELWLEARRETLAVGFTAGWLAQARDVSRHDRVFLRAVFGGAGRAVALRALATQILTNKCPVPAPGVISSAVDGVHREARDLMFERWALPPSVVRVLDPNNAIEVGIVELVAALAELRRAPYRRDALMQVREHATRLGIEPGWLKMVLRELDDAMGRVNALLTKPATASSRRSR